MTQTFTTRFKPNLGLGRQYASVSANCRELGDEIMRAALEDLSPKFVYLSNVFEARIELLRRVHTAFEARRDTSLHDKSETEERQLRFLRHVAGLSDRDISLVTGTAAHDVQRNLESTDQHDRQTAPARVLIIEDDVWIAAHIREILIKDGHNVVGIAKNRADAGEIAKRTSPNLLICDVRLEDGSCGIESAMDIQNLGAIPMVFVTAFPGNVHKLTPINCAAVIAKPFSDTQIRSGVAIAMEKKRAA